MIYLSSNELFEGVQNLNLNEISFYDFTLDFKEFNILIISSKNAIKALKHLNIKADENIKVFAVGQKSAEYARDYGFKKVYYPQKFYANALVKEFAPFFVNEKCLYLRAKNIHSKLDEKLIKLGAKLSQIIAYENKINNNLPFLKQPAVFIFSAFSHLQNFIQNYHFHPQDKIICIGKNTAKALNQKFSSQLYYPKKQSLKDCVLLAFTLEKSLIESN